MLEIRGDAVDSFDALIADAIKERIFIPKASFSSAVSLDIPMISCSFFGMRLSMEVFCLGCEAGLLIIFLLEDVVLLADLLASANSTFCPCSVSISLNSFLNLGLARTPQKNPLPP